MSSRGTSIAAAVLLAGGAAGVLVSAAGGGIDAEVTGKGTDGNGAYVVVTTDLGGLDFQRYLPIQNWMVVQEGDDVVYHVHNGETEIYAWGSGSLIWRG